MQIYSFEIVLSDELPRSTKLQPEQFELMANRLFEAGCDDSTPSICEGVVTIDFAREAASLGAAIDSAIAAIRSAGYTPVVVHCEELIEVH